MTFTTIRQLSFGHCDPAGMAYFPAYLDMLVGVTEELFESIGAPWPMLFGERHIGLPTQHLDITFRKPGFHGDRLSFSVLVAEMGETSIILESTITVAERPIWLCRQRMVCTSLKTRRPLPWPSDLRIGLLRYANGQAASELPRSIVVPNSASHL